MDQLEFNSSPTFSIGVELELQLVNTRDFDLTRTSSDLLSMIAAHPHRGNIKPEITESMIEISTGVHTSPLLLLDELRSIRDTVISVADKLNVGVAGGGAHPFQHWSDRRIFDRPRFRHVSGLYGYLAKQFTVFGQHIHIGCPSGDDALYLLHALSRYIPHFIALSASSPFYQGVDTAFDSSRLNSVFAFPLSGRAPFMLKWSEFNDYFDRMRTAGIIESMKDFYWDVRPKPDYGTVEIRVCDTPVTVEWAAMLAAYAQALSRWLLSERPLTLSEDIYLAYSFNRFQACRFGMEGELVDVVENSRRPISEDILATLDTIASKGRATDIAAMLGSISAVVQAGNEARRMREHYSGNRSLPDLVRRQVMKLRGEDITSSDVLNPI